MLVALCKLLLINTAPNMTKNKAGNISTLNSKVLVLGIGIFEILVSLELIQATSNAALWKQRYTQGVSCLLTKTSGR